MNVIVSNRTLIFGSVNVLQRALTPRLGGLRRQTWYLYWLRSFDFLKSHDLTLGACGCRGSCLLYPEFSVFRVLSKSGVQSRPNSRGERIAKQYQQSARNRCNYAWKNGGHSQTWFRLCLGCHEVVHWKIWFQGTGGRGNRLHNGSHIGPSMELHANPHYFTYFGLCNSTKDSRSTCTLSLAGNISVPWISKKSGYSPKSDRKWSWWWHQFFCFPGWIMVETNWKAWKIGLWMPRVVARLHPLLFGF